MPLVLDLFPLIFRPLHDTVGACPRSEATRSVLFLPRTLLLSGFESDSVTLRSQNDLVS